MGEQLILLRVRFAAAGGQRLVGSPGQHHDAAEVFVFTGADGRVVQRGRIDFNQRALLHEKRLHFAGVISVVAADVLPLADEQNHVGAGKVQLGIAVIFHCVQQMVAAVAVADLDGHAAVGFLGKLPVDLQRFETANGRLVNDPVARTFGFLHFFDEGTEVVSLDHSAKGFESAAGYGLDRHVYLPSETDFIL